MAAIPGLKQHMPTKGGRAVLRKAFGPQEAPESAADEGAAFAEAADVEAVGGNDESVGDETEYVTEQWVDQD